MLSSKAKNYPVSVDFVENDGVRYYHAWFPLFDNVDGAGDSVEEAVATAYEMLEVELEYRIEKGIAIPELSPKQISLAASGRITLRMPKSLHNNLSRIAEAEGVSLNTLITTVLASYSGSKQAKKRDFSSLLERYLALLPESQRYENDLQGNACVPNRQPNVLASA